MVLPFPRGLPPPPPPPPSHQPSLSSPVVKKNHKSDQSSKPGGTQFYQCQATPPNYTVTAIWRVFSTMY